MALVSHDCDPYETHADHIEEHINDLADSEDLLVAAVRLVLPALEEYSRQCAIMRVEPQGLSSHDLQRVIAYVKDA